MTVLTKVCSHFAPFRPHSFTKARTQGTPHRCSMTFRVGQPSRLQADVRLESLTHVADLTTKSDPASGVPPGSKGGSKSGKGHPFLAAGKRGWPFPSRVCHPLYAIRHLSSAIRHLPSAIRHLPSAIRHLPSAIRYLPSAIRHLPSAIRYLPSAICHPASAICHPVFVICHPGESSAFVIASCDLLDFIDLDEQGPGREGHCEL